MNTITEHFDVWKIANQYVAFLLALLTVLLILWLILGDREKDARYNTIEISELSDSEVNIEMQSSAENGASSNVPKNVRAAPTAWPQTMKRIRQLELDAERDRNRENAADGGADSRPAEGGN